MKKMNYALAPLVIALVAACGQKDAMTEAPDAVAMDTTEERLSYGIAYGLGERLKADGVPLDVDAFGLGLQHAFDGSEPLLTQEEIGAEMQAYQQQQAGSDYGCSIRRKRHRRCRLYDRQCCG